MKRIYLIDCPGVVPPKEADTPQDILLKGVVRVENVENPEQYVAAALNKCKKKHVLKTYEMVDYKDHYDFLEQLARKGGRLLKGGEPDLDGVAKMVLNDFLRGKLPWFTALETKGDEIVSAKAEGDAEVKSGKKGVEGSRTGDVNKLNKLATAELRELRKRKRGESDVGGDGEAEDEDDESLTSNKAQVEADEDDNESFASFTDDESNADGDVADEGGVESDEDEDGEGGEGVSLNVDEDA